MLSLIGPSLLVEEDLASSLVNCIILYVYFCKFFLFFFKLDPLLRLHFTEIIFENCSF